MNLLRNIVIALVCLASLAYLGFSYNLAKSIVKPDVLTLEKERQWIEEHQLVGDFDSYEKEDFTFLGYQDYKLHGQFIRADDPKSKKYVIITHGFRSNRNGSIKYVDSYHKLNYNVIIYDVRGHGENEKTAISLGNFESKDLYALIGYTYQTYGSDITLGLHGESMGSATSLSVLGQKPKLAFVVADCGFTNLYDLIHSAYKDMKVGFLIHGVNIMTNLIYGVDMKKTSPIEAVKDNTVPVLFIHGENDAFIKSDNSDRLAETNPSKDFLKLVPKAEHAASREVMGEQAYTELIKSFLESL